MISQNDRIVFENLFVLELANNHWGNLKRGLKIVRDFATVARVNSVKVAIKLQFRDVDSFIHPSFKGFTESRYIKKTEATKLSIEEFKLIIDEIFADEGPKLKRIRPRAQGRAYKILKPTCHITVVMKETN